MTAEASDIGEIITLYLTSGQREFLEPLVRRQVKDRRGLIFVSVAPFFDEGTSHFRMQAKWVRWKDANKALRIINESNA